MLNIACENNLSETAFCVKKSDYYEIRWFTPGGEVDLCGHATLASAFFIMNFYEKITEVHFKSNNDFHLSVMRKNNFYEMEFPAYELKPVDITDEIINALGLRPKEVLKARDLLCVLDNSQSVVNFKPDLDKIEKLDGLLLHITAYDNRFDCVSRSFAPKLNISEDSVCGSGHCHIAPYWCEKLNKNKINAYQASKRGGKLSCEVKDNKVFLSDEAVLFSKSELYM